VDRRERKAQRGKEEMICPICEEPLETQGGENCLLEKVCPNGHRQLPDGTVIIGHLGEKPVFDWGGDDST